MLEDYENIKLCQLSKSQCNDEVDFLYLILNCRKLFMFIPPNYMPCECKKIIMIAIFIINFDCLFPKLELIN